MQMLLPPADVEVRHYYILGRNKSINCVVVMHRQGGSGEVYTYMPEFEKNAKELLAVPPKSCGNYQYGFSVGRGAFVFPRGRWVTVAERVKLNDPGEENGIGIEPILHSYRLLLTRYPGELEIWFDGKIAISVSGLIYRVNAASKVQGAHFETFFGGKVLVVLVIFF